MQVRKQQLELDMEQQTGSKQEKEFVKAVYCQPVYLTYMHDIQPAVNLQTHPSKYQHSFIGFIFKYS